MSVLSNRDLMQRCIKDGVVDMLAPSLVQPASLDLRLGSGLLCLSQMVRELDPRNPPTEAMYDSYELVELGDWYLNPGQFVLGCTLETVRIPLDLVGRLEGKSSLGRLGLIVHVTAGYIDPGFHGKLTLEMLNVNTRPICLSFGMSIAQLSLLELSSMASAYSGKYQGQSGTTPARSSSSV